MMFCQFVKNFVMLHVRVRTCVYLSILIVLYTYRMSSTVVWNHQALMKGMYVYIGAIVLYRIAQNFGGGKFCQIWHYMY